jgi:exopolysaccharide biosynthesis polyprenyl glycosylphosphotransferase
MPLVARHFGTPLAEQDPFPARTKRAAHALAALADSRGRGQLPIGARGRLLRRLLMPGDLVGLALGFFVADLLVKNSTGLFSGVSIAFLGALPVWIAAARLHGLYRRDEERTGHATTDEIIGIFLLVTALTWLQACIALFIGNDVEGVLTRLAVFWAFAILFVLVARAILRELASRCDAFLQNAVIVGSGVVAQRVARKLINHSEYGVNVVGFVDTDPSDLPEDLRHLAILGPVERLDQIVRLFEVERVVVAFSRDSADAIVAATRLINRARVHIDIVPRLFEVFGPNASMHMVEGIPLVGLPPTTFSPFALTVKRTLDVIGAAAGLLVTFPLFVAIAFLIKRESPGPVFFRQPRLGRDMRQFTFIKFRTMRVDTSEDAHRQYIYESMERAALPAAPGLYKLTRDDAITRIGAFLRKTSLDELPQLINVLRGDMSLVGPRPCLRYETDFFEPHHFERFRLPAGLTGLWQVTARARASFAEALEMDVAYVRGWSLGLDFRLLFRTPRQIFRTGSTA